MAMKQNGKAPVSSDSEERVMSACSSVALPTNPFLGGSEPDQEDAYWPRNAPHRRGTVIQGFIPPGRIKKYLPDMKQGSVYQLDNFYGSKNKPVYRVSDHIATVSFTWNSEMWVLHEVPISFDEDRFRFHSYEDFEANCDLKGDLYVSKFIPVVLLAISRHMKLVNGQTLIGHPILDEVEIATSRHIMVHVQSHDGLMMKLYLWDQAATDFCKKFNSCANTATVLLVTTVNTKRLGDTLALHGSSWTMTSNQPKITSPEVVTKRETLTIADIFSYMTQESAKDAFFECTATIDDVVHGSAWYYIACSACHSKATKGATSLICTNTRCEKVNTTGVAQYRAKISVYDNSEQAFFVLLGDAGRELTGRHASELVSNYFKANKNEGPDHEVPIPEALISTIGQTHKFCVKVTDHNFSGNTRAITVTKILSLDTPPPTDASVENTIAATSEETMQTGNEVCEPSKSRGGSANEESKRTSASADPEKSKRPRCENDISHATHSSKNLPTSGRDFKCALSRYGQLLEGRLTGNIQPNDPKNLTEGDIYEFSGFSVIHNFRHQKLTQLPYYIQIDQKTITSKVTNIGPIFPFPNFSPQNYKNLLRLATTPTYLPDVVGQVLIIQKIIPHHPELNIDATIGLRLNRSTIVKLILCDKQAADFSILQSNKNRKFKVVIITTIIPKLFQGKLLLSSSPATNFYFNKSIDYIKHFKGRIRDHVKACTKESL
ncbi:hypothetical protein IGI04_039309 [Brassica rapa subsp. trilocularis]|uniref:Replication factor A C-terminal domain-containing protein n=1 Tax=Brassica rapa subsp. trilocularis TaxID=1813537 RepID=A0ABQ7KNY8_BRACM|nr:hypothetical protein IGI04_039309 [Brassica rapa subsp. trilocularis]